MCNFTLHVFTLSVFVCTDRHSRFHLYFSQLTLTVLDKKSTTWPFFKSYPSAVTWKVNLLYVTMKRIQEKPKTTIGKKRKMWEGGGPFPVTPQSSSFCRSPTLSYFTFKTFFFLFLWRSICLQINAHNMHTQIAPLQCQHDRTHWPSCTHYDKILALVEVETWHVVEVTVLAVFVSMKLSLRASPPSVPVNKADTLPSPSGSYRPDSSLPFCKHKEGNVAICWTERTHTLCLHITIFTLVCVPDVFRYAQHTCVYGNISLIVQQCNKGMQFAIHYCIYFFIIYFSIDFAFKNIRNRWHYFYRPMHLSMWQTFLHEPFYMNMNMYVWVTFHATVRITWHLEDIWLTISSDIDWVETQHYVVHYMQIKCDLLYVEGKEWDGCQRAKRGERGDRAAGPVTSISLLCWLSPLDCEKVGYQPRPHPCRHTYMHKYS